MPPGDPVGDGCAGEVGVRDLTTGCGPPVSVASCTSNETVHNNHSPAGATSPAFTVTNVSGNLFDRGHQLCLVVSASGYLAV